MKKKENNSVLLEATKFEVICYTAPRENREIHFDGIIFYLNKLLIITYSKKIFFFPLSLFKMLNSYIYFGTIST